MTRRWLHGSNIDEPLTFEAYSGTTAAGTGAINEVFADRQGSILAVIDPVTGTKSAEYTYDSFGQLTQVTGTLSQPFAYTAREYDAETGLYYYRARYYDPALGQFVSADPIGFAAGDLNIYTYVENDPFNWSDPSGYSEMAIGMARDSVIRDAALLTVTSGLAYASLDIFHTLSNLAGDWWSNIVNSDSDPETEEGEEGNEEQDGTTENVPAKGKNNKGTASKPTYIGDPGTTQNGDYQDRRYNADGTPKTDVDWDADHEGVGRPHSHDWEDGVRGPARPSTPEEIEQTGGMRDPVTGKLL